MASTKVSICQATLLDVVSINFAYHQCSRFVSFHSSNICWLCNMLLLIFIILPLANCALLQGNRQIPSQSCLASFLIENNISSPFNASENTLDEDCSSIHKKLGDLLEEIYADVEQNLNEKLSIKSEADCLMHSFRKNKFLEINIVLRKAYALSSLSEDEKEFSEISRKIFTYAIIECLISKTLLMELFDDFSVKVEVDAQELDCIVKYLQTTTEEEEPVQEESSTLTTNSIEISTETQDSQTTKEFTQKNAYLKTRPTTCIDELRQVQSRITNYKIHSLDDEENICISKQLTERDIVMIYELIVLQPLNKTSEAVNKRNETLLNLIIRLTWIIVECTNITSFTNIFNLTDFETILSWNFPEKT